MFSIIIAMLIAYKQQGSWERVVYRIVCMQILSCLTTPSHNQIKLQGEHPQGDQQSYGQCVCVCVCVCVLG